MSTVIVQGHYFLLLLFSLDYMVLHHRGKQSLSYGAFSSSALTTEHTVKPSLNGHSQKDQKLVLKTSYHLMQAKSIAECSNWSILQYFQPSVSYHLSLRSLFCLFLSGLFKTGFTVGDIFSKNGTIMIWCFQFLNQV